MKHLFLLAFLILSNSGFAQNDTLIKTGIDDSEFREMALDSNQQDESNKTYLFVEQMPQFKSGDPRKSEADLMKFISKNLKYPKEAYKHKVKGRIMVRFRVTTEGKVSDAQIISKTKLGYGCEEEALRVIQSIPDWELPGKQNGIPVNVFYSIPIVFKL